MEKEKKQSMSPEGPPAAPRFIWLTPPLEGAAGSLIHPAPHDPAGLGAPATRLRHHTGRQPPLFILLPLRATPT